MECLIGFSLFYELYLCITVLFTLYCIYKPPALFGVFPLYYWTPFHCQYTQLTFCILGKDSYHFTFVLPTPLAPNECHDSWGEMLFILLHLPIQMLCQHNFPPLIFVMIVGPFTTTTPIIFHGIHIFTPQISPPPSQHEVQRYWEAAWISDVPSPRWGKVRIPKLNRRRQGQRRVCGEISRSGLVLRNLYHARRIDLEPEPELLDFHVGPFCREWLRISLIGTAIRLNLPPINCLHGLGIVPPHLRGTEGRGGEAGKWNRGVGDKCWVRSNWINKCFWHFQEWCLSRSSRVTVHLSSLKTYIYVLKVLKGN